MKISAVAICIVSLILSVGFRQPVLAQSAILTATVRPNPLEVKITAPSDVAVGQWFNISADVTNLGDQSITGVKAIIQAPTGVTVNGQKKEVGTLAGGQTKTVTWRAKANDSGNFIIQVEASGNLAGEQISSSDSVLIHADATGDFEGEQTSSSDSVLIQTVGSLGHFLRRLIFSA